MVLSNGMIWQQLNWTGNFKKVHEILNLFWNFMHLFYMLELHTSVQPKLELHTSVQLKLNKVNRK